MPTDNQVPAPPSSDQPIGSTDADKVVWWNWVLRSIENNPDHTVVISRMADGNLSFLHGNPIPELEDEVEALTNALKELVECKDLKDKIDSNHSLTLPRLAALRLEYNDRKPLAWAAARKLVPCDHDYEVVDERFDHELGTSGDVYRKCLHCGEETEVESEAEQFESDIPF